ncbi:hypothetical protein CR513_42579, partial [Mucuna pruriens]
MKLLGFESLKDLSNPLSPLDLIPLLVPSKVELEGLSKAQSMVRLHERAKVLLEKQGKRYVGRVNRDREGSAFVKGHLVWSTSIRSLHLRYGQLVFEDKFSSRRGV